MTKAFPPFQTVKVMPLGTRVQRRSYGAGCCCQGPFLPLGPAVPAVCLSVFRETSFNVVKSESGHWRNEVQGLLNRQTFFLYKDNKCHAIGAHGNSLNATKICEKQVDTLKHGGDIFKGMLLQLWGEFNTIRVGTEPHTLQADICCQYEGDNRFRGSSVVSLNGKNMLHVDTSTGNWTELDPRFKKMMAMWKKDRDIAAFLDKTSRGYCRTCLEELKSHWKDHPEPTEKTIKTVDRIQHTSDNALVIIGSTLAAMLFMGLIISGSCYVSRRHLHERKMDVQSSSPSLLGDSLTLPETSSANEADEFPTASQNSVLLTLDHTDGNP
ncbi:retinoic acid early transcript 1E-like isoform X2 [Apodemus sylvaticus]|uniref:retinoic acid early transcript 1E-like isoform X2 n=1 Tax=Apodemus sylvaticus TaxID=10129 RepID=UPI0022434B90|nr:retinoic acid early transcript 1E-like isoform X2 [Apodemus sylvaticus]